MYSHAETRKYYQAPEAEILAEELSDSILDASIGDWVDDDEVIG